MAQLPIGIVIRRTFPTFAGIIAVSLFSSSLLAQNQLPELMGKGIGSRNVRSARSRSQQQVSATSASENATAETTTAAAPAQNTESVVYAFGSYAPQGFEPESGLVSDSAGNLYGSTYNYGPDGARGIVYKVNISGNISILYAFTGGTDGGNPTGDLIRDGAGNLYGTTVFGGDISACADRGCGVIFKLDKSGHETVLYSFKGGANGANPYLGKLTMDSAGNLYGITSFGGNMSACSSQGCGVVFKLAKSGAETTLYAFNGTTDGAQPNGGLVLDNAGNLYGTTRFGGNPGSATVCGGEFPGCGVVYKLDQTGHETVLYAFKGTTDGALPYASLTADAAGNLYGAASVGGNLSACSGQGCGVVFKLDKSGNETLLHTFSGNGDGGIADGGVIFDKAGSLYGATAAGGDLSVCAGGRDSGCGVVYKLDKYGNETVLHIFAGAPDDGAAPNTSLTFDNAGNLHGTTTEGGTPNFGAVYELEMSGNKTQYISTSLPSSAQGSYPTGGVVTDWAGNLYGVAVGGEYAVGVVYKLDKSGKETILHAFTGANDGTYPNASLAIDGAGNIYGTTYGGGNSTAAACTGLGCGVVYKLDKTGKETVLYTFQGAADGSNPEAGVILDNAGNLYGTAAGGGNLSACSGSGCGVVFKVDKTGKETVLYTFNGGADGAGPSENLTLDSAGNLYGTASAGGDLTACPNNYPVAGCGVVFKVVPSSGTETVLYPFTGGADGASPSAVLIFDNAGNIYGTAGAGGNVNACPNSYPTPGCGVVFKLVPSTGKETVLYTFNGAADGASPGGVIFDSAGNLDGLAFSGGSFAGSICSAYGCGVIFKVVPSQQKESVLYTFTGGTDGANPNGSLIFDSAGNLYGNAEIGGQNDGGLVFKIRTH